MPRRKEKRYERIGDREIPVDWFFTRVEFNPTTGCQEWQGPVNNAGYGLVGYVKLTGGSAMMTAHRMAWMIHHDCAVPQDQQVQHQCHNKLCVTPSHLHIGDHQEKMKALMRDGRHGFQINPGYKHAMEARKVWHLHYDAMRKYSREDIQFCRHNPPEEIAVRFGVSLERAEKMRRYMRGGYRWLPYDRLGTQLKRGPKAKS